MDRQMFASAPTETVDAVPHRHALRQTPEPNLPDRGTDAFPFAMVAALSIVLWLLILAAIWWCVR